jgi:hypothetical protein
MIPLPMARKLPLAKWGLKRGLTSKKEQLMLASSLAYKRMGSFGSRLKGS